MIDSKAEVVPVSLAGYDFTFVQSPGILLSSRPGGTTGGAIWQTSVKMAEWFLSEACPFSSNTQFRDNLHNWTILELGCGICPLLALALYPKVQRYIATDQDYILPYFRANFDDNVSTRTPTTKRGLTSRNQGKRFQKPYTVNTLALDWEIHDVPRQLEQYLTTTQGLRQIPLEKRIDVITACDCVFNEDLVMPFVEACTAVCKANHSAFCVIGQQVRSPEILALWMSSMVSRFRLFRIRDNYLTRNMSVSSGFILHMATLRDDN